MKILLLEDNEELSDIIQDILEVKGFEVHHFVDGEEALYHSRDGYDCFILDINVPNVDGLTLLKEIRDVDEDTPAIIISSNIELETVKKAYTSGCHDFLKKPFYMYELEAKIELLCQKTNKVELLDGFSYDVQNEILFNSLGHKVKLTKKEKRCLNILLKHPDQMTTHETIEQYVWEGEIASVSGVRSMIKRLRTKLPKESIITHNYGYELVTKI